MAYILNIASILIFWWSAVLITSAVDRERVSHKRLAASSAVVTAAAVLIVYCQINSFDKIPMIAMMLAFILGFLIQYKKVKLMHLYTALVSDISVTFFSANIDAVIDPDRDYACKSAVTLGTRLVFFIAAVFINRYFQKHSYQSILANIPKRIYVLIAANLFCCSFITAVNNYDIPSARTKALALDVLIMISVILNITVTVSLIFNVLASRHSQDIVNLLDSQINLQISHYEHLDRLNADMRRFRHDYINHLHSVLSLIKMNEAGDAENYIENLLKIEDTPVMAYHTGNHLADAILSDKLEKLGSLGKISFEGMIPSEFDNVELCTILSNSLDNAVEACTKQGGGDISVKSGLSHGYLLIKIANPTDKNARYDAIPPTSKTDPENHGLGLLSIEQVARKHEGKVTVNCADGVFELSVLLKTE